MTRILIYPVQWEEIKSKPPICSETVETEHMYRGPLQLYKSVKFPGAEYISIRFDSLSSIATTDYVTIYKVTFERLNIDIPG